MKKAILIPILSLVASVASAQLTNLDFENWYPDTSGHLRLTNWEHLMSNANDPNFEFFGTWRDSVAEHGIYALTLSRWYDYADDWVRQKAAAASSPAQLSGYYEYVDNTMVGLLETDTALVQVFLTKWNSASSKEDTVGSGKKDLTSNPVYTAFNCPITYISGITPDSVTINIFPTKWFPTAVAAHCPINGKCSYLTVDNLSLQAPSGIMPVVTPPFRFYPNPAKQTLTIKTGEPLLQTNTFRVLLTDCVGRVVLDEPVNEVTSQINLANIMPGNYFIVFKNSNGIVQFDKITKE